MIARFSLILMVTFVTSIVAAISHATIIVDLDPGLARFDSLTDNDDLAGGFGAGSPGGENDNGLTFNVTFTPAAGDLDSATDPVLLVEIGGDANGSGMYLLGGEVHFISKMNSGASNVPGAINDLDWDSGNSMIAAKSAFGALTAGTEYSVAAVFDPINSATLQLGISPGAAVPTIETFELLNLNGRSNWSGDNSATALRPDGLADIGNYGGAAGGFGTWGEGRINANRFEGTAGQALYWSLNGTIVIPEPSSLSLLVVGICGCAALQRRRRLR